MDSLDEIKDLIKSCLLPELQKDLDSIPIEKDNFKSYHELLAIQLPLLYDYIQQQPKKFVWSGDPNDRTKQEVK